MQAERAHLRGPDQGKNQPHIPGNGRDSSERHLHGRYPPHDRERYLHYQRCRAGVVSVRFTVLPELSFPTIRGFTVRIIPYRGSWLEFEIDQKRELIYTKIDRKKRVLGTLFLRCLGYDTREKIIELFYKTAKMRGDRQTGGQGEPGREGFR